MNLFELVLKQMRQRALSTCLTTLSVLLGVALAVAVLILWHGSGALFGQTSYGYDLVLGPSKSSRLSLILNSIYHLDRSQGNMPYSLYEEISGPAFRADVRQAFPIAVGDSYKGQRIVGTTPKLFGYDDDGKPSTLDPEKNFSYRPGKLWELADGKMFAPNRFEAVIGADVTRLTGLKVGDTFQATHGLPAANQTPDIHPEIWKVVGVLKKTVTANDRVIFIPLQSFYCIGGHLPGLKQQAMIREGKSPDEAEDDANAPKPYVMNPDGSFTLTLPKHEWAVSVILVKSRSGIGMQRLQWLFQTRIDAIAANPAEEMRKFFDEFLNNGVLLLLVVAALVSVVAAVSILVSIYNSVSARMREIAIIRALGATRSHVLTMICLEASLVGLMGGVLGLIAGHLIAGAGSAIMNRLVGEGLPWIAIGWKQLGFELLYLLGVVLIAFVAGLVPALKAYRTPVATNLVGG